MTCIRDVQAELVPAWPCLGQAGLSHRKLGLYCYWICRHSKSSKVTSHTDALNITRLMVTQLISCNYKSPGSEHGQRHIGPELEPYHVGQAT